MSWPEQVVGRGGGTFNGVELLFGKMRKFWRRRWWPLHSTVSELDATEMDT